MASLHHRRIIHSAIMLSLALIIISAPSIHPTPTAAQSGSTHTVQAGETLFRIALRYNMTVETLAAANGIADPTLIYAGQVLTIPDLSAPAAAVPAVAAASAPAPAAEPVYHIIQRGETLASIGRTYGIGWTDIAAANGIANANQIFAGQQILIPNATAPGTSAVAPPVSADPAPAAPVNPAPAAERTHIVQRGEHLASIARIYGLSWPTIARANNITDPNKVFTGQQLIIPAQEDGQGGYAQPAGVTPPAASPPTTDTGKQIVVDLSDQRVYAYENGALLRNVLVSTGMWGTPTVQGDYRVYLKYDSQTMSGPGYYLPGVPWVMYFYRGYSLHGTYWHSNWGTPMSHGCVNMPTPEAAWFYTWAEIGTPVHVQY